MRATKPSELRDPQDALRAYLDEMLHLATAARPAEVATAARLDDRESRGEVADPPVAPDAGAAIETVTLAQPMETAPAVEAVAASAAPAAVEPEVAIGGRPTIESAADRFRFPLQCLMFRVGGHLLAMPLVELAGVIRIETRLARVPGLAAEVLGLLQHRDRTLRVVDSGALLGIAGDGQAARGHLLLLATGDWALTCDTPEKVAYLGRDEVQWRVGDADRIRYGTIRESLATLLDPGAICRRLERAGGA